MNGRDNVKETVRDELRVDNFMNFSVEAILYVIARVHKSSYDNGNTVYIVCNHLKTDGYVPNYNGNCTRKYHVSRQNKRTATQNIQKKLKVSTCSPFCTIRYFSVAQ